MWITDQVLMHTQSFASLLSSIGGKAAPQPQNAPKSISGARSSATSLSMADAAKSSTNYVSAGVKRKRDDGDGVASLKATRIHSSQLSKPVLTSGRSSGAPTTMKSNGNGTTTSYGGTAKQPGSVQVVRSAPKLALSAKSNGPDNPTTPSGSSAQTAPKRGFASIMEKAKAAQALAESSGSAGIKHKPVTKLSKRERLRAIEEAKHKPHKGDNGRPRGSTHKSTSGDADLNVARQVPGYKRTMKKAGPEISYRGTMRKAGSGEAKLKSKDKKDLGQDKYGGYASWSDLDDAEEVEEDYDSEGSSAMEEGFDDMEREELAALRAARKEDQEALEEEERHRQEKLARKKRLQDLNKVAAGKKRF